MDSFRLNSICRSLAVYYNNNNFNNSNSDNNNSHNNDNNHNQLYSFYIHTLNLKFPKIDVPHRIDTYWQQVVMM